jgi:Glycosyl hydrolase family 76
VITTAAQLARRLAVRPAWPIAFAILAGLAATTPAQSRAPARSPDLARAQALETALDRSFATDRSSLLAGTAPPIGIRPYSLVWPYSQALVASLALTNDPGVTASDAARTANLVAALQDYWSTAPPVAGYADLPFAATATRYYDDNSWLGLALDDAAAQLHQPELERRADAALAFVESGWDTTRDVCPGGVFFVESARKTYRAATSTAPAAQLAAVLYIKTHRRHDLEFAQRAYAWMNRCLRGRDGLYADHIDADGTIEPTEWSYNQGSMIAAGVELWRATGERRYLAAARTTGEQMLLYVRRPPAREPVYLMAILFDDLRQLDDVTHILGLHAAAQAYADSVWTHHRNPRTNLIRFKRRNFTLLLEQAAAVRLYATLADWTPP